MAGFASRVGELYRRHLQDPRRERHFIASATFFFTFAATRLITHAIRAQRGPFKNVSVKGTHIHHLVLGILGLLGVGSLWLSEIGTGPPSRADSRATAAVFGASSALTLDEFALWLDLEDVYWTKQGRKSVDAVVLFGAMLSTSFWGRPFFRAVSREILGIRGSSIP